MTQKKTLFFAGIFLCLMAAGWMYYLYQKPRSGVEGENVAYSMAAKDLYQAFAHDEAQANKKYTDKVLQVEGVIQQVDTLQGSINILLAAAPNEGGINCSLVDKIKLPTVGEQVIIKGRCAGFLMDVSLVDAVIKEK